MKRTFFLFVMLIAGNCAQAQDTPAETVVPPKYVAPVPGEKIKADSAVNSTGGSTQQSDYQIINGRKVKVDNQGIQSLEVVDPVPVAKPAAKDTVQ